MRNTKQKAKIDDRLLSALEKANREATVYETTLINRYGLRATAGHGFARARLQFEAGFSNSDLLSCPRLSPSKTLNPDIEP